MKTVRKIIHIDEEKCNGCGACVPSCAEGAIRIEDGKAKLIGDRFCDGLGACLGECPQGALALIDAEAEAFDERAVHENLKAKSNKHEPAADSDSKGRMPCGCSSTLMRSFTAKAHDGEEAACSQMPVHSELGHWPVQIRLVPADAPFLKNADLLVAADCTAFAYPAFHRDLLKGKAVLVGCPKLDDIGAYRQKFAEIFQRAGVQHLTVAIMEVPCCRALPQMLHQAMADVGKHIPMDIKTISVEGQILDR